MNFDLSYHFVHNGSDVRADDGGVRVSTPSSQWAYALEVPAIGGEGSAESGCVTLAADCLEGIVGVALLHRDGSQFITEIQLKGIGAVAKLNAPTLADVKAIIVRNVWSRGASTAVIKKIEVGPNILGDEDVAIDQGDFRQVGDTLLLPRRRGHRLDPASAPLLPPHASLIGSVLVNAYIKEVLGKKTFGRVLNIGAGGQSARYRYDLRLRNSEYHTLEPGPESNPTYVADARRMPEVASESYDWVLAIAVLEHVNDMHAVVSEIKRVLKPGGYVYLSVPFHNELHFTSEYGDYWRVSPFGFHELLDDAFAFEEVEYWGDCVIDPVGVGVIARKGGPPSPGVSRLYYIDGGLDTTHRYIRGDQPFHWTMPVTRLSIDGIAYCLKVQDLRSTTFSETGYSLTHRLADKQLFHEFAIPEGTIVISNEASHFVPSV